MLDPRRPFRTRASLRDDLIRLGVRAGDTGMVHAAMGKVGLLLNGPDALIGAQQTREWLQRAGPEGEQMLQRYRTVVSR